MFKFLYIFLFFYSINCDDKDIIKLSEINQPARSFDNNDHHIDLIAELSKITNDTKVGKSSSVGKKGVSDPPPNEHIATVVNEDRNVTLNIGTKVTIMDENSMSINNKDKKETITKPTTVNNINLTGVVSDNTTKVVNSSPSTVNKNYSTNASNITNDAIVLIPSSSTSNSSSLSTKIATITTTSTTPSTTTTTTMTTTTTTTEIPKKPLITLSALDDKDVLAGATPLTLKTPIAATDNQNNHFGIEEPVAKEYTTENANNGHRDLIIPIIIPIFAIPFLITIVRVGTRRIKDYWATRHYRRMDFLVDGMYND